MIKLDNVNKYFNRHKRNQIHVINNTSLNFPASGMVALLGPSGCGKTTLLNVIGGLDKVNSGHVYIDGVRITKRNYYKVDKIRNLNIGYIFQDYKLVENMTVYENVALSLKILGYNEEEINKRVLYTLEKVNMLRYKNRPVSMLSGGERQRIGIARALVKNPKIIIADEPTGNLDSKNSLEIMNIIKSISKKYLVILVTHEVELAKFYADRVVELQDGKVINDYENNNKGSLDYKIDNKIYLKDFKNIENIKSDNININVYSDTNEKLNINIVSKNGNIYINTKNDKKIEIVDNNSNIELIDDSYKKIEYENLEDNFFDVSVLENDKYKPKYSSIFNWFSGIKNGFKKLANYPALKKFLLLGFFISGMFIYYSISSIMASVNIKDKDFITMNKEYLTGGIKNLSKDDYLKFENFDNIEYILPGDSIINFKVYYDNFLQTQDYFGIISGSLSSINMIKTDDLILGSMPNNSYEIVLDKMTIDTFLKSSSASMAGLFEYTDLLNHEVYINNMEVFKIVGITDLSEPNIYAEEELFINIIANSDIEDYYDNESDNNLVDYNLLIDKEIKMVKGSIPSNDYEIIVNELYKYEYELNKEINQKVNDKKLKVVGYYSNNGENNHYEMMTNSNTIKYKLIDNLDVITVYPKDKDGVLAYFHEEKINMKDSYIYSKDNYISEIKDSVLNTIIVSLVILSISLVEVLLMVRSSFLSRIKEVGIYRAIGIKKSDIYKMFAGEIFAITITSSVTGITFMAYILYNLTGISYLKDMYMVNGFTYILSIMVVLIFNLIVGLFPVFNTIRKTPAQILARYDID